MSTSGKFLLPLRGDFEAVRASHRQKLPGRRGKKASYGFLHGCGCPVVAPCDECSKSPERYPCEVVLEDSGPMVHSSCTVCRIRKTGACSFRWDKAELMGLEDEDWGPWSYEDSKEMEMGGVHLSESEQGEMEVVKVPRKLRKKEARQGVARIAEGIESLKQTMKRTLGGLQGILEEILEVQEKQMDVERWSFEGDEIFWDTRKRNIDEVEDVESREGGSKRKRVVI